MKRKRQPRTGKKLWRSTQRHEDKRPKKREDEDWKHLLDDLDLGKLIKG